VELLQLDLHLVSFVAKNTYVCYYEPSDLTRIRALPDVDYANVYHDDLVIHATFKEKLSKRTSGMSSELREVAIFLHDEKRALETMQELGQIRSVVSESLVNEGYGVIRAEVNDQDLNQIAMIENASRIQEVTPLQEMIHKARKVIKVESVGQEEKGQEDEQGHIPGGGGYGMAVKVKSPADDGCFRGSGETVVVADSGFDLGDPSATIPAPPTVHPDFRNSKRLIHAAFKDRVVEFNPYARADGSCFDQSGHGTHVAGCALGSATSKDFGLIEGSAPEAFLYVLSLVKTDQTMSLYASSRLKERTGKIEDFIQLPFKKTFNGRKPRVENCSIGDKFIGAQQTAYDNKSITIDGLVYNNQDYVIVLGSGNEGHKPNQDFNGAKTNQVAAMASTKNTIVVGACENQHFIAGPNENDGKVGKQYKYAKFPFGIDGNPNRIAEFSSRGPSNEGRTKPDVVAPGCTIYSARSRGKNLKYGKIKDSNPETYDYDQAGKSPDKKWWFLHGTSMAAPLVSGCCAILRAVYLQYRSYYPSAAMVKALIVNGAVDLHDNPADTNVNGGKAPNNVQGFGRVNLARSLIPITDEVCGGVFDSQKFYSDQRVDTSGISLSDDQKPLGVEPPKKPLQNLITPANQPLRLETSKSIEIFVPFRKSVDTTATLTVTMAYPDKESTADDLVNEVNLKVRGTGETRIADPDPNNKPRGKNNVQRIIWKEAPIEQYTILIELARLGAVPPSPKNVQNRQVQHYAVCWSIEFPD
jgi:serine protease AprX